MRASEKLPKPKNEIPMPPVKSNCDNLTEADLTVQYIEWIDSVSGDAWEDNDIELDDCYRKSIKSIGFLLKEDDEFVCLCNSVNHAGDNMGRIWIPKVSIRKRQVIKMPSEEQIKFLSKRLKKQDKRIYERRSFEPDELIQFLRKNKIRTIKQLRKMRKPGEPSQYDYVKAFDSWAKAKIVAFGKPIALPRMDANYIIDTLYTFNVWTQKDYRALIRKNPGRIPSERRIKEEFGTFGNLLFAASLRGLRNTSPTT